MRWSFLITYLGSFFVPTAERGFDQGTIPDGGRLVLFRRIGAGDVGPGAGAGAGAGGSIRGPRGAAVRPSWDSSATSITGKSPWTE